MTSNLYVDLKLLDGRLTITERCSCILAKPANTCINGEEGCRIVVQRTCKEEQRKIKSLITYFRNSLKCISFTIGCSEKNV